MLKRKIKDNIGTMIASQTSLKKSTIEIITSAVESVLTYGSVFQKKLSLPLSSNNRSVKSSLRSMERFFEKTRINVTDFFRMIENELNVNGKVILAIDRTNWCYGLQPINLFVVAVVYGNFAVPIVWDVLKKKGTSNTAERKKLMRMLLAIIPIDKIEAILADREFIGKEWFLFLHKLSLPFIIRIKNNSYVTLDNGLKIQVSKLMKNVKSDEQKEVSAIVNCISVRLVATRSTVGELVAVAASKNISGNVLDNYKKRWLIELCFKSLKSNGFNIEDTHITNTERINKLFAIVAIACLLAVKVGVLRKLFKKIPVKNHGRPQHSTFTYGLDFIVEIFSGYCSQGKWPSIYKDVLDLLFDANREKAFRLRIKNVGY